MLKRVLRSMTLGILGFNLLTSIGQASDYDPLDVGQAANTSVQEVTLHDADRDRDIPLKIYLPETSKKAPLILYSHGLGGSRDASQYTGAHWSKRGYVVVCMQHAGSDEAVWKDKPLRQRLTALRSAVSTQATVDRLQDVPATLDALERWTADEKHDLHGRIEFEHVGMSGHSYGAVTTQGVSGQTAGRLGHKYLEPRIDAAVMFSPSFPRRGGNSEPFKDVTMPWMLMTGTQDTSPVNDTSPEDRRKVFVALPTNIDKFELVLFDAQHSAFGDTSRRRGKPNPNHHRAILALSTAFWDAYLRDDQDAAEWLQGEDAKQILEARDVWQANLGATDKPTPIGSR